MSQAAGCRSGSKCPLSRSATYDIRPTIKMCYDEVMGFKCGIVGLPNVGKSTLFNALTAAGVAADNYPFCTTEPHMGTVAVPDKRLSALSRLLAPERVVPAVLDFVDIAGLVRGASRGEGMGNEFLDNLVERRRGNLLGVDEP